MLNFFSRRANIIAHAIPSLLAIAILDVVNVQVFLHGPVSKSGAMLIAWLTLQLFPALIFAYLSDRYSRKKILIFSQLLGLCGGIILSLYGFEIWVLVLVGLTFNPQPVARAALLDNFPNYSRLKLIAITFLAQYSPWAFFSFLSHIEYTVVVHWLLIGLGINIIFTFFFFRDPLHAQDKIISLKKAIRMSGKSSVIYSMLIAFVFAEITFYVLWNFLEYDHIRQSALAVSTYGTLLGIAVAMLYVRLPHISIITLFYSIGAVLMFITLMRCFQNSSNCLDSLIVSMNHYSIIGGLYLPFITDAIINMVGSKYKAVGSASVELCSTLAAYLGAMSNLIIRHNTIALLGIIVIMYVLASLIQRRAEKLNHVG